MESPFLVDLAKISIIAFLLGVGLRWTVAQLLASQAANVKLTRELIDNATTERKELADRCTAERIESLNRIRLLEDKTEGLLVTHLEQSTRAINAVSQAMEHFRSPSGHHLAISKIKDHG